MFEHVNRSEGAVWHRTPAPEQPDGSFGYCPGCYHPLDQCSHCDKPKPPTISESIGNVAGIFVCWILFRALIEVLATIFQVQ